jgi:hypothetical protein
MRYPVIAGEELHEDLLALTPTPPTLSKPTPSERSLTYDSETKLAMQMHKDSNDTMNGEWGGK